MEEREFHPKKKFGQNFLIAPSLAERMANIFSDPRGLFVEVGGGFGALTEAFLGKVHSLVVLETDPLLYQYLLDTFSGRRGLLIERRSILDISFRDYLNNSHEKVRVIGNLPYALTSPILIHLVKERLFLEEALVTLQKEVAQRLYAKPKTKSYSPLSCLLQLFADVLPQFSISREAFYPRPEVESEVVRLRFLERPKVSPKNLEFMIRVIRTGFGKRRKTLANALSNLGEPFSKKRLLRIFQDLGFSQNVRAEELSLEDFARLSDNLYE